MADVIARQMLYALFGMSQMLLQRGRWLSAFVFLADVIANGMWQMFLPLQCIATIDWLMLLQVADGIATHCLFVFNAVWVDVIALWQMEWPHFVYL